MKIKVSKKTINHIEGELDSGYWSKDKVTLLIYRLLAPNLRTDREETIKETANEKIDESILFVDKKLARKAKKLANKLRSYV